MHFMSSLWFIMKTIHFAHPLNTKLDRSVISPNYTSLAPCQRFMAESKGRIPESVDFDVSARKMQPRLVLVALKKKRISPRKIFLLICSLKYETGIWKFPKDKNTCFRPMLCHGT